MAVLHRFNCIVRCINTSTEKLAEVAEYEVQQYVLNSSSYIRDTKDFVNKLKEKDGHTPYRVSSFFVLMFADCIHVSKNKRALQLVERFWKQEQHL